MARIIEITKDYDGVTTEANIAGMLSPIVTIEVRPTKSYTVYQNALFQLFLQAAGPINLPDVTDVELWIEDVAGDQPIRLRIWKMSRFNNANQFNTDEQIHLDVDKSYKLDELRKIVLKVNSASVVDWTLPTSDFMLQVEREG